MKGEKFGAGLSFELDCHGSADGGLILGRIGYTSVDWYRISNLT